MSRQWPWQCYKSNFYISQHKEFHTSRQIPPKKMPACPCKLGLLLRLARPSHSVHAPGHYSVGKDSRVDAYEVTLHDLLYCPERLPRGNVRILTTCPWYSGLWKSRAKGCLCMHRSALWHMGDTLGHSGPGPGAPWRWCAFSQHVPTAQHRGADSWGIPGRNTLQCAVPAGTPSSRGRPGRQSECQVQHPPPLPSPAGDSDADSPMGCSTVSTHQTSLCFRSLDEKTHGHQAEASHKTLLNLLPSSAHQPALSAVCGDISCSHQRQRRDGAGRGLREERGKHWGFCHAWEEGLSMKQWRRADFPSQHQ